MRNRFKNHTGKNACATDRVAQAFLPVLVLTFLRERLAP
jgi:hypothetical protein